MSNIFILRSMKRHNVNFTKISSAIRYKLLFTTLSEYRKLRDKKGKPAVVRLFGDLLFFFVNVTYFNSIVFNFLNSLGRESEPVK